MDDGFADLRRYTYRPRHSDGESFSPAFWTYILFSVFSCGLLAPICLVVGGIHYLVWKLTH